MGTNNTKLIKIKASFHNLKTILYYFPDHSNFKADLEIFYKYFSSCSKKDLKRGFHELSEHEYEHQALLKQEFTDVYCVNPVFKETFKPSCSEDIKLILEDISREIWCELEKNELTFTEIKC